MDKRKRRGETAGTLRAYFLLAGGLNLLSSVSAVMRTKSPIVLGYSAASLVVAAVFLYLGVRLELLLRTQPDFVRKALLVVGAVVALGLVANLIRGQIVALIGGVVGLALVWYLHSNTTRLAREMDTSVTAKDEASAA